MRRIMTKLEQRIIRLYQAGESTRSVAQIVEKSQGFVAKIVRESGVSRTKSDARKLARKQGRVNYSEVSNNLPSTPWNKGKIGVQENVNKGQNKPEWSGENHWNWQGGITEPNHKERCSLEYKTWAREVKERDDYTCVVCKNRDGGYRHSHHVLPFSEYPEHRYNISNGITMCKKCHDSLHKLIRALASCETLGELLEQLRKDLVATAQLERVIAIALKTPNTWSQSAAKLLNDQVSMEKVQRLGSELDQTILYQQAPRTIDFEHEDGSITRFEGCELISAKFENDDTVTDSTIVKI
jgi:hypothetical protein